jgi:ketosteroid isomerase-like protein
MTTNRRSMASLLLAMALALLTTSLATAQGVEAPRVPLRTAIKEINTLRAEYAALYNRKDTTALTAMYLPDAIVIRPGSMLTGQAAVSKAFSEEAANWGQITLSSDTTRVFGNTAWDVGSMSSRGSDGNQSVQRYLVVLRRGVQTWQISSVAVVPETPVTAAK